MPWLHRWVGTPFLTAVLNLLFNTRISDANCGLRGFSAAAIRTLNLRCNGMEFASEMVVKAAQRRLVIRETPIDYFVALPGRVPNLHTFRDGWRHLRFMLMLALKYVFLFPGLIMSCFGFGFSLLFLLQDVSVSHIPLGLSATMFVNALSFMGIQIALFGVYAIAFSTSQGFAEEDWISRSIKKYFRLEWGLAIGSSILLFSVVLGTFTIHLRPGADGNFKTAGPSEYSGHQTCGPLYLPIPARPANRLLVVLLELVRPQQNTRMSSSHRKAQRVSRI